MNIQDIRIKKRQDEINELINLGIISPEEINTEEKIELIENSIKCFNDNLKHTLEIDDLFLFNDLLKSKFLILDKSYHKLLYTAIKNSSCKILTKLLSMPITKEYITKNNKFKERDILLSAVQCFKDDILEKILKDGRFHNKTYLPEVVIGLSVENNRFNIVSLLIKHHDLSNYIDWSIIMYHAKTIEMKKLLWSNSIIKNVTKKKNEKLFNKISTELLNSKIINF
jgi:hypothetical protein